MPEQTNRIIVQLDSVIRREVIDLTLRIHGDLVQDTPVDTGWAQNNWLLSVGSPIEETVGTREAVDRSSVTAGVAMVLRYQLMQGVVYITNNVPYIQALNDGHSEQAPANFVQMAIQRNVAISNGRTLS